MATFQQPGPFEPQRPKVRPSAWWYVAPPLIFILGIVIAVVLAVTSIAPGFDALTKSLVQFTPPATGTVTLSDGDEQTIYLQTEANGVAIPASARVTVDDVSCRVTGPGEQSITVGDAFDLTVTQGDDKYKALKEFTAAGPGTYTVRCEIGGGARDVPLALGKTIGLWRLLGGTFGAIAAFFAGGAIAIGVFVLILVLRIRSKRRSQGPPAGGAGSGGQPMWTPPAAPTPPGPAAPPPQWPPPEQGPQWPPTGGS